MPLAIYRHEGETWRQAVSRQADLYGMKSECLEIFDREVILGTNEARAAWEALYEWDCLDYAPD
jgi:hypothetical protein